MPKNKKQRQYEYYQNHNHIVGSEAWLSEEEMATRRRIEDLESSNNPRNNVVNKEARKRKLNDLMGIAIRPYDNIRG